LLGGQSDKSARRDRSPVHEGHCPNPRIQQSVADQNCRIQPPAESIDLENNGGGACIVGFVKDALNERRESEVDDSLDRRDVNYGRLLREGKSVDAEKREQSDSNDK